MTSSELSILGVLETGLYADDLGAAERFYHGVLGLDVLFREEGRHVFFRCGTGVVLVFNPEATRAGETLPPHGAEGPGHAAFAAPHDALDDWQAHLDAHGVAVEKEMTWPGGGRSLYVRDPAGNSIELATPDLWGEAPRDDRLRQIRPASPAGGGGASPVERFQRRTLLPLCSMQTPVILQTVARHLQQHAPGFRQAGRAEQEATVRTLLETKGRVQHTLVGLVAGHFTEEEYAFYVEHEDAAHRRLVTLLTRCVLDRLEGLPL